jgi:site-specific DNA recombinase
MWMGGVVPLGYDVQDRKLLINPTEAETVRFIYKRYLELGCVRELWNDLRQKQIVTKTIPTRPGSGGRPFSRGGLYHFLNNPIFIGQIRFREAIYDGQHEPIIDLKTWDAVQMRLAGNRAGLMGKCSKDEQALLRGKLYDAATGEQLAANSSTKNGRRYRYYITRSLYKETRVSAPTGWRLSGPVIEKTVDMVVRSMLADQSSILLALSNADVPATLIPHVLEQAKAVLASAEPIIEGYVSKVSIGPDRIEVKLSLAKLIPEGMELPDIHISQTKPMRMQRRNNEMRLVLDGDGRDTAIDSLLVKGIAQAHIWAEELFTGQADSLVELAERHKVSEGYLKRLMPMAFLAPDIVTSVLAGKQPDSLNKHKLASKTLPLIWQEQRHVLAFDKAQ